MHPVNGESQPKRPKVDTINHSINNYSDVNSEMDLEFIPNVETNNKFDILSTLKIKSSENNVRTKHGNTALTNEQTSAQVNFNETTGITENKTKKI